MRAMNRVERAAVAYWQGQTHLHPMTCRNDSSHRLLREIFPEGTLGCLDCDWRQEVPEVVIDAFLEEARHAVESLGPVDLSKTPEFAIEEARRKT